MTKNIDIEHRAAVEAGDMDKAALLVSEAAKRGGYTIGPVFHNSRATEPFHVFDTKYGSYFTSDPDYADSFHDVAKNIFHVESPQKFFVFLKITTPETFDGDNEAEFIRFTDTREPSDAVSARGHDGQIMRFSDGHADYRVNSPEQIKSADPATYDEKGALIPLSLRFTDESTDIRGGNPEISLERPSRTQTAPLENTRSVGMV